MLEELNRYLHLQHYTPKNRTRINFWSNISVWQGTDAVLPKNKLKWIQWDQQCTLENFDIAAGGMKL